jgi:hypothetical protein
VNILFFSNIILSKNRNGGEVASQFFIDALRQAGHQVMVVGYLRQGDRLEHDPNQTIVVAERYTETRKSKLHSLLWIMLSFVINLPYSSTKFFSWSYVRQARRLLSQRTDAVIIDHAQMGWLLNYIKKPDRLILNAHNIEHEIYAENVGRTDNLLSKLIYRRESQAIKRLEDRVGCIADQVWTLTQHDADYFSKLNGSGLVKQFDIPPGLQPLPEQNIDKKFDIGLIASWSWRANEEALQWFLTSIYPLIPFTLKIQIAGKGADWIANRYPNIDYVGVVPDAQQFMAEARVVAIPTLSGGGIQIKTLDAIASGSRIVATPIALRGITNPPATIQIAEDAKSFAQLLIAAVASAASLQAYQAAQSWSKARQTGFVTAIEDAITQLKDC